METIYLPKKIREELKNASIGEKFYYTTRDGFIHEIQKLLDGFSSRTLNPSRKGLARVINITPPKPFRDWEAYHKSRGEKR